MLFLSSLDLSSSLSKILITNPKQLIYMILLALSRHLRFLNISASPFQFTLDYPADYTYTFFNCSSQEDRGLDNEDPCLSSSTYKVYALENYYLILYSPMSFCSKMFTISIPPPYNTLHLMWSDPMCKNCESKGKRCGFKNRNSSYETACFEYLHKGSSKSRSFVSSSTKWIITGSILGSLLLVVTTAAIYYIYNSRKSWKENQSIIGKFLNDYRALKPTRYSYAEIKRITNQFEDKLGQGSFGTVFKGKISSQFLVAVKILANSEGNGGEEFITEVGTMGRIHHINIVRLIGFCADGFRRALVYEYLPHGSLQNFINSPDNKQNFLGWKKLQEVVLDIAKGIEYLHHGCEQRILHFDIKPRNVLLDHDFTPKICDFGLAKLCSKDQSIVSITAATGTLGYITPKVFSRNFGNVSHKSDVYSFGMLLLETIGRQKITKDTEENTSHIYYPEWISNILEEKEDVRIHIEEEGDARIAKKTGNRGTMVHPMACCGSTINASSGSNVGRTRRQISGTSKSF